MKVGLEPIVKIENVFSNLHAELIYRVEGVVNTSNMALERHRLAQTVVTV